MTYSAEEITIPEEQEEVSETEIEITQTKNIKPVVVSEVTDEILKEAAVYAAVTKQFANSFIFYGRSLQDWADELAIAVPTNLTPDIMRQLYIKLANNIQVASHFHSIATTTNNSLMGGGQIKHADIVTALVKQYGKKRPAASVIEKMADSYMKPIATNKVAAKIVKEFWRQRLDALTEVRKCLEQIGISMHTELKYLQEQNSEQ